MNIIPTIIMGNIEMELPAIHIMNKFIGSCFRGPSAMSQDFYKTTVKAHSEQIYENVYIKTLNAVVTCEIKLFQPSSMSRLK